jgi:hypothetical protein
MSPPSSMSIATCSILKMEVTFSSETSVDFQWTTRRYIPEDRSVHNHRCENGRWYMLLFSHLLALRSGCSSGGFHTLYFWSLLSQTHA